MQLVHQLVVMFRFDNNLNNKWLVWVLRAVIGKLRNVMKLAFYLKVAVFTSSPNPVFALHFWVTRNRSAPRARGERQQKLARAGKEKRGARN